MKLKIGHLVSQPAGFKAFIPLPFPPAATFPLPPKTELLLAEAMHFIGKLDGISHLLPDTDFFLSMFVKKEATSSSQIEGTKATMTDAIMAEVVPSSETSDVEDIIHYIKALNYGMKLSEELPLSIRFISELHEVLMKGARSTHNSFPGHIRYTQNWIGGTTPKNAHFVPPPPHELPQALSDLEKFIHAKNEIPSLIKAALIHAQFETIHPFVDGNGRTGRMLITMYLWQEKLLEKPLLYLSDFFKKHRETYYERLDGYHSDPARVEPWIEFFLQGVIFTSKSAVKSAIAINKVYLQDMDKMHKLGKVTAATSTEILKKLFNQPIVDVAKIQEWTGFTRAGAQKVIDRFIGLNILIPKDPTATYKKMFEYHSYLSIFQEKS